MATNPMHQFNVYKIGPEIKINGIDLSFTNASLFMLISAIFISLFLLLGTKDKKNCSRKIPTDIRDVIQFYFQND